MMDGGTILVMMRMYCGGDVNDSDERMGGVREVDGLEGVEPF